MQKATAASWPPRVIFHPNSMMTSFDILKVPKNPYRRSAAKSKRRLFAISCHRIFPKLTTQESAQIFASEICLACWAASVGQKRRPFDSWPANWWWSNRLDEDVVVDIFMASILFPVLGLIPEFGLVRVTCRSLLLRIFCIVPHGVIPLGILA